MNVIAKVNQNKHFLFAIEFLLLTIISALMYLILAGKFGYYFDDWYLMFDAKTQGAQFFTHVFEDDRPLRSLIMIPAYTLFGANPLPYNLSAYFARLFGAVIFLWILRFLWPHERNATFVMALLFLVYPGFLSQPNAIDYLSHHISLLAAMASIALTFYASITRSQYAKWLAHIFSIILGWFYLGLMEYYLGFEVLRLSGIVILIWNRNNPVRQNLTRTFSAYYPAVLIPMGFLIWRLFFFQSTRSATSVDAQIDLLLTSPLIRGGWWGVHFLQSLLNTVLLAWGVPLYNLAFQLRLREFLVGTGIAILSAFLTAMWLFLQKQLNEGKNWGAESSWAKQAIAFGSINVVGGLILVIFANRYVDFTDYSRYTIVSSAGAVVMIVGILYTLHNEKLRISILALMVAISALTHYANSTKAVLEAQSLREFWWQVSWRIPQIKRDTTLAVFYPASAIPEDYFIWGPANLIYAPEKQNQIPLVVPIPAAVLNRENTIKILSGAGGQMLQRRGVSVKQNFDNVLVITQPATNVCVRVLDGESPELSMADSYTIMLIAPKSQMQNVLYNGVASVPHDVFGEEPGHDWCYYYEKADLARQQKQWQTVLELKTSAVNEGLYPNDRIEWMPFLQAYTALGDLEGLEPYISIMVEYPFIKEQACKNLLKTALTERPNDMRMQEFIQQSLCD